MRIGAIIDGRGLEGRLDATALVRALTDEETTISLIVSSFSAHGLRSLVESNGLEGLVIACQNADRVQPMAENALHEAGADRFAVKVINLHELCAYVHPYEDGTEKARLLLAAAIDMLRQPRGLRPANLRLRFRRLAGRVSRRALLTAPMLRYELVPAVDASLCVASRGCDLCLVACPVEAIRLSGVSALVNKDRCLDCGLCVSVCPTGAADHPFYGRRVLGAGLAALLADDVQGSRDRIVAFACRGAMSTLREAGRRRLAYPATVLPLEMPSAGVPDLYLVLRAFDLGAAAVAILSCDGSCSNACRPQAFQERYSAVERVLDVLGLGSERLTLVSTDCAERLASRLTAFAEDVLCIPPHVLCQELPVPVQMHQYRTAGLLAGISRRIGIGDALSVGHEGLPFGQAEFEANTCSLCGLCSDACPTGALRYSEDAKFSRLEFAARDCTGCRLCSAACPEGALNIARRLEQSFMRDDPIVLKSADLRRCQQCGRGYAPEAMVSRVLSRLGSRAPAALAAYCPDCRMTAALRRI